jgi:hypothetical protein
MSIIRSAASELPHVDLGDALAGLSRHSQAEPHRFERAALRWLARFCVERREATLAEVQAAHGHSRTSLTSQPHSTRSND